MYISTGTDSRQGEPAILASEAEDAENLRARARQPQSLANAPRCHARTRRGTPCQSPIVKGRTRCRIHGGAKGSGGQKGERNGAYRHGGFTQEAIADRRRVSSMLKAIREDAEPGEAFAPTLAMLRQLGEKQTRAERKLLNRYAWANGDRTAWGGEDRRNWPKHPGRHGYRGMRRW